jgi:hypothetical protein
LKISRNTARYQLKSVFAKTDTHRQGGEALYRAGAAINRKAVCAPAAPRPLSIVGASTPAATA